MVNAVAEAIGLNNLTAHHARVETIQDKFDFVVSRAVTEMKPFLGWIWNKIEPLNHAGSLSNGVLYLKGEILKPNSRQQKSRTRFMTSTSSSPNLF